MPEKRDECGQPREQRAERVLIFILIFLCFIAFEAAVAAPLHIVTQHTFAPGTPTGACSLFNYP